MTQNNTTQTEHMDVAYVAHLARLHLTDEEIRQFEGQLNQVLDYIQTLKSVDVEGVEPMAHARPVFNVFREDVPGESLPAEAVRANAPEERAGLFIVPKIIE
jgi:aspartyl-tRNA(Asn)/glutamyl-tRNA(Gln) amidotransferase subunit C